MFFTSSSKPPAANDIRDDPMFLTQHSGGHDNCRYHNLQCMLSRSVLIRRSSGRYSGHVEVFLTPDAQKAGQRPGFRL